MQSLTGADTGHSKDVSIPEYDIHPDIKMGWFYCIFGRCFAKPVLIDNRYYHKVCCFKYSTDGKGSYGCYISPDEVFPINEHEYYHPENEYCALLFCGLCLYYRWKRYNKNYKKYGKRYANYMYYTKGKYYDYHECCSPDFVSYY